MDKEKISRELGIMLQPSLFKKLKDICDYRYKTVSETVRELIVDYIRKEENKLKKEKND